MIGKTISHYKIIEKLGEGGMGVVYKAEDTKLERTVALKFLSLTAIGDEEKKRFKREAKAAASLNHPNIATIHAIDEVDDQTFIAMEYIEGQSIEELVAAHGGKPMPMDKAIDYATQTAAGLQATHKFPRPAGSGNLTENNLTLGTPACFPGLGVADIDRRPTVHRHFF